MTANRKPATYFHPPRPGDTRSTAGAITNAMSAATTNQDDETSTSLPATDPIRNVPGGRGGRGASRCGSGVEGAGPDTSRGYPTSPRVPASLRPAVRALT